MYEKFDTLVIEPDMAAKMRIKAAMGSVPTFGKVVQVSTMNDGREKIKSMRFDVVFISCLFPQEDTSLFIREGKENPNGQDAAYVLVLKSQKQESSSVAQNVLVGADGLLFEPYSVDSLVEITRLAALVKGERAGAREMAAIKVLLSDIMEQISLITYLKGMNFDTARQMKKFADMCSIFQSFDESKRKTYLDTAIEVFESAPLPAPPRDLPAYKGVSSRIRKRIEDRVREKLERDELN